MSVEKRFAVKAQNGKYLIDGQIAPKLELISGKIYEFDLSDASLVNHPLKFKEGENIVNGSIRYDGTHGVDQVISLTVPSMTDGVGLMSYYCENHAGMGSDIEIKFNIIYGTDSNNSLTGLSGSDWIEALEGNDTIDGGDGDDYIDGGAGDDILHGGDGDDLLLTGSGDDFLYGEAGDDTIILYGNGTFSSAFTALNISSSIQTGTEERIKLVGKTRFEDVMDGGGDVDTVELTNASDAFFLHDSFSGFHSSLTLSNDYSGKSGTARVENIENINAGDGDDIVDLTSPDYSLAGQTITVDGGEGDDTLWGSDANETIKGSNGDDVFFGGAGINELIGGSGADEFQFTKTSKNDTISDLNISDGDTLKFFNTGGAQFDRDSIALSSAGDELSIAYGSGADDVLTISLTNAGLQLNDLTTDVLIIA